MDVCVRVAAECCEPGADRQPLETSDHAQRSWRRNSHRGALILPEVTVIDAPGFWGPAPDAGRPGA